MLESDPLIMFFLATSLRRQLSLGFPNHNKNTTPIFEKLNSEDELEYVPNLENQQDMCKDWTPSTSLLRENSISVVTHEIVAIVEQNESSSDSLIEREGVTLDDIQASTSRHPKPSWCKNPSRSSEMSSHEYECDSFLEPSIVDVNVYVIHCYSF